MQPYFYSDGKFVFLSSSNQDSIVKQVKSSRGAKKLARQLNNLIDSPGGESPTEKTQRLLKESASILPK